MLEVEVGKVAAAVVGEAEERFHPGHGDVARGARLPGFDVPEAELLEE